MVLDPAAQTTGRAIFTDLAELESKLLSFITEWNEIAHPFDWTKTSFEKILAKVDNALQLAA